MNYANLTSTRGRKDNVICNDKACVVCGASDLFDFYRARNVPVNIGALWQDRDEAINCRTGDITLALCQHCGLIANTAFDPDQIDYGQAYDNSLEHSAVFRDYALSLAERLIESHDLHNKRIVEIGCGNGSFLKLLCELGENTGVGYDPSYDPSFDSSEPSARVSILSETFEREQEDDRAEFICCRQVLEHISSPLRFLSELRDTLGDREVGVYFEVPNMMHALQERSIGTFIYEHCVYYCKASLANTFRLAGFDVQSVTEGYDRQFLGVEAHPSSRSRQVCESSTRDPTEVQEIVDSVNAFHAESIAKRKVLHDTLVAQRSRGTSTVVWGAGARAVSILNSLDDHSLVHSVVDINPNKHGKFLAGSGHAIVPPESLKEIRPSLVVVMNEIYADEISEMLRSMGQQCEIRIA